MERGPVSPVSLKHDPCEGKAISRRRITKVCEPERNAAFGTEYPAGGGSERSGHLVLGLIAAREWGIGRSFVSNRLRVPVVFWDPPMKVRNSLKSLRTRHRANQVVRRRGRVYIINRTQKRYKARQG